MGNISHINPKFKKKTFYIKSLLNTLNIFFTLSVTVLVGNQLCKMFYI